MDLTLTHQMIEDFRPYLKRPDEWAERRLREAEELEHQIVRIEDIPWSDAEPNRIRFRRYYHEDGTCMELDAKRCGVDSL